jgi:hypothetical protein
MSGTLMRADMFDRPAGPTLDEAQAVQAAIDAATALHAINWRLEVTAARELYELPTDVFRTLRIWRVNLNSGGRSAPGHRTTSSRRSAVSRRRPASPDCR